MKRKVSIVIPIFNMDSTIERSLKSIQQQDYSNIEIILVDDGSTDNTLSKCKVIEKQDDRVIVIHTENRGSGPARNTGIDVATGDYIYFPDADDYLIPTAISTMVAAMEQKSVDLVVFGFKNVNNKGKILLEKQYDDSVQLSRDIRLQYKEYMDYTARWAIQGAPWNKLFNLNIIKKYKIEYPPLRRHQDEGFIGRYMCYSEKVHFITDILYTYYVNDLKKEWQKYPLDYIDAVIGLYEVRKDTILRWNPKDKETHDIVKVTYIVGVIKALELSFSKKYSFNGAERFNWICDTISKSKIYEMNIPEQFDLGYQKKILSLIKQKKYKTTYKVMMLKVFIECNCNGVLSFFKNLKRR